MRYEMKIPTTTGTAGMMSLVPTVAPASTPATTGVTSAIAPIVAIQPPSTDIHEVLGRTRTRFTITPLRKEVRGGVVQNAGQPVAGRPARRALPSRRLPLRTSLRDRSSPREARAFRNARRKRSADRWDGADRSAR